MAKSLFYQFRLVCQLHSFFGQIRPMVTHSLVMLKLDYYDMLCGAAHEDCLEAAIGTECSS